MKKYNYRMVVDANKEYDYYCYRLFITEHLPNIINYFEKIVIKKDIKTWLFFRMVYQNGAFCRLVINDNILGNVAITSSESPVFIKLVSDFFAYNNLGQVYNNAIFLNTSLDELKKSYLDELQRFYHYDTSKEKLAADLQNFMQNNEEYLKRKRKKN